MSLEWFICPDKYTVDVKECLTGFKPTTCRLGKRCLTLPYLSYIAKEREWSGVPSTTQLLNGTMLEFLKLTQPYAIDPDSRAFSTHGSLHHAVMEEMAIELNLPTEVALSIDRDIFDLLEPDELGWVLTDYKTWGSYRVAKALGIVEIGKKEDPSGEVYKSSGKWGKAGSPKMIPVFQRMEQAVDLWDTELQLNRYRMKLESMGLVITGMQVQITVRDGGLAVARSRGLDRNMYKEPVKRLDGDDVKEYFYAKEQALKCALKDGWTVPCDNRECWDGARCKGYCDVALMCPKGLMYKKQEASK